MNWTKEQQQAIDERNKNILVAAAAGSGKTAVLVERIKKLIIEDQVPIDRMLIVTFTNAAAAEMKEKIRVAINKEIDKNPLDSTDLRNQLNLMNRANISTFHAFALDVIKRYFYLTDVEPGFSICDEAQSTLLKEDAMDALMEKYFDQGSEEFYEFLDWYSSDRNQNKIREIVGNSYKVLQSLPYPWKWLREKVEELSVDPEAFKKSKVMEYIMHYGEKACSDSISYSSLAVSALNDMGLDSMASKVSEEELASYERILKAIKERDFDETSAEINSFKSTTLRPKKDEKEDYNDIKEYVAACRKKASLLMGNLKAGFFAEPIEDQVDAMNRTYPMAKTLEKLLLDYDVIFKASKEKEKLIDFNDIEHYCLEILENQEPSQFYKEKFLHIFIDEYQDTNILQEEIIARVKGSNNLFMVGDLKQSIYKFRLAEPEIFKKKYEDYRNPQNVDSVKIDLNKNYRSKSNILTHINGVFEDLMEDYDEEAKLYPGLNYDGSYNYNPQFKIVDTSTVDENDEEIANLKNAELEALEVCRIIKDNLGKAFYDAKSDTDRKLELRDIVILMRGARNYADVFYNILKDQGIASYVDDNDGYFDTMEINVFLNLLAVIDNKLQDVPLISVLHSEIFGFTSTELAKIRANHKNGQFADAFMSFAEEGQDAELCKKTKASLDAISRYKDMAATLPLPKFIWMLMIETGYYLIMGAMPDGTQRQANLRALVDKAESFSTSKQGSLYGFIKYIDAVKLRKVAMGQVKLIGEKDNLVRIMTIHKSKGLEFPMVIVAGLGKKLNYSKSGYGVTIHKDIGIGMTLASYEEHWYTQTILQKLIAKQVHTEEVQEEIRVLYVALTRAKDILYLVGTVKDGEKYKQDRDIGITGDGTYLDMIDNIPDREVINCSDISAELNSNSVENEEKSNRDIFSGEISFEEEREVLEKLNFTYPFEKARTIKSKYSVSELNQLKNKKDDFYHDKILAVPKFRQGERKLTGADRGTIYHGIMERIDFNRANCEGMAYLNEAAEDLISKEIFTLEEIKAIDLKRIEEFFKSDLGKRCSKAYSQGRLEREKPFNLLMENDGDEVIVQGIIDCFFEESDGLVLLDYKSNWIDSRKAFDEEADRLKRVYEKQIKIYKDALETVKNKKCKEAFLFLIDNGKVIEME